MWKMCFFIILFIALPICIAISEDVDVSNPLTLEQCIKIALKQSPNIKTAELDLITSNNNVKDAKASFLPEINSNGQYQFSDTNNIGFEKSNYNAQISASYRLWDQGRRRTALKQARANEQSSKMDYSQTEQGLIFNITDAYYNLLQSEKLISVDEKLLEISKRNVEKAKLFLEKGQSTPADVASAKVQQASDELTLINSQNDLKLSQARLSTFMGLDKGKLIKVQDDPDYKNYMESSLIKREFSLDDSITKAIQNRPELNSLRSRLTSSEWSLKQSKFDRWPVLSADYNYNLLFGGGTPKDSNIDNSWNAVARFTFPLFDGGVSKRRQQNAEINVQQTKESVKSREQSIALEVQQEYFNFERATKSLDIAKDQVENATLSLDVTQGRYDQGMTIFLDVLSAQARYAQSITNQVKAFYDYKIAEKSLQKAVGDLKAGE
jgi:outer membrane protein